MDPDGGADPRFRGPREKWVLERLAEKRMWRKENLPPGGDYSGDGG
jgi:hypothetical protein